ncbi:MAG: phosphopyruvate hydratase [Candidatus Woesearchaeota archaeon]
MKEDILITQILDSRGNPTLQAQYRNDSYTITAAVPSGASTGVHEALELRDKTEAYSGKAVATAQKNASKLAKTLSWSPANFLSADESMIAQDATKNKSLYGANALLALSQLQARVQAHQNKQELFALLAEVSENTAVLPLPFANVINGGEHAENALVMQEFMIVPIHAQSFSEATRQVAETYHCLKQLIADTYGPSQTALGDEGGFAPDVSDAYEACELLMQAMRVSGHEMAIAMDPAASEFYREGRYWITSEESLTAKELAEYYVDLAKKYPLISIEDAFDQDDFAAFAHLKKLLLQNGLRVQIVGDDLTVTNTARIQQAIDAEACDSLLLKINQIGTISEALEAAKLATSNDWTVMVSHRSGETEDSFIADLAVGLGTGQIKLGAPARGERTAKYNRLLTLEALYSLPLRNDFKRKH